jgi:hypothetical protein
MTDTMPTTGPATGKHTTNGRPHGSTSLTPHAKAEALGATVREQPRTFVSGDRFASILDPFGPRWSIMTRVEDLSPEESAKRVADWAASQQA